MTDLYDDAERTLRELNFAHMFTDREAVHRKDLRARGLTNEALAWRARTGRIQRLYRGAYLAGPDPATLPDRLAALRLVLPDAAAVAFQTAATLHGFGVIDSDLVHVLLPIDVPLPRIRGVKAHHGVLPLPERVEIAGSSCVPAPRCAVDLARTVRRLDALPVLDAALRSHACTLDDLIAEVARHDGLRGVRQARDLLGIADPRAQCRQESQLRLVLRDGGLPAPEPQIAVNDGSVHYVVDLGYREERVGVEYDGASHLDKVRMRADRLRHNWLEGQGWTMRYFTDHDLYRRPDLIVATVRAALGSRRSRSSWAWLEIKPPEQLQDRRRGPVRRGTRAGR